MSRAILLILRILTIGILLSPVPAFASTTILMFGDSLVAGYGLPAEKSLPAQTEAILKVKGYDVNIINAGVSGDTTTSGRTRFEWTLDENPADIVILALGGNDILRGVSPRTTRDNLDYMMKGALDRKVKLALVESKAPLNLGPMYAKEFNTIYEELANTYDVPLHPYFLEPVFGKSTYVQPDGIHPNIEGTHLIAQDLADFIEDEYLDSGWF